MMFLIALFLSATSWAATPPIPQVLWIGNPLHPDNMAVSDVASEMEAVTLSEGRENLLQLNASRRNMYEVALRLMATRIRFHPQDAQGVADYLNRKALQADDILTTLVNPIGRKNFRLLNYPLTGPATLASGNQVEASLLLYFIANSSGHTDSAESAYREFLSREFDSIQALITKNNIPIVGTGLISDLIMLMTTPPDYVEDRLAARRLWTVIEDTIAQFAAFSQKNPQTLFVVSLPSEELRRLRDKFSHDLELPNVLLVDGVVEKENLGPRTDAEISAPALTFAYRRGSKLVRGEEYAAAHTVLDVIQYASRLRKKKEGLALKKAYLKSRLRDGVIDQAEAVYDRVAGYTAATSLADLEYAPRPIPEIPLADGILRRSLDPLFLPSLQPIIFSGLGPLATIAAGVHRLWAARNASAGLRYDRPRESRPRLGR